MRRWVVLAVVGLWACILSGCVAPTFDLVGGNYPEDIVVALSCKLGLEKIYYTTDGSNPTKASSLYSDPIAVEGDGTTLTIKAISILFGLFKSSVVSATYTIEYDVVQAPKFTPVAGQYDDAINVTITCATGDVEIYYTLDGTDPTKESMKYTTAIPIAQSTRVKAIAVYTKQDSTTVQSAVAEADYLIGCMDSGSTAGDPHFYTYDGIVYHNQYIGEFVLTREAGKTGFEVQTRQGRVSGFSPCVTLNTATAMRIGADKVEYRVDSDAIIVNGAAVTVAEGVTYALAGGSVRRSTGIVCSDNATGATVTVRDFGNYLNVTVTAPCALKGTMEGLMGNYDGDATNDQRLRDGTVTTDTAAFMNAWRLTDAESLFTYGSGLSTASYTGVQTCDVHPSDANIAQAQQIYDGIFGAGACDAGMVYAIAVDLAAGMSEADVIAWVKSIQGYVAPKGMLWYKDADGDGYGNSAVSVTACAKPDGYVASASDCNDADPTINPGTVEISGNGIDENCDGIDYILFPQQPGNSFRFTFNLSTATPAPPYVAIDYQIIFANPDLMDYGEGFSVQVFDDTDNPLSPIVEFRSPFAYSVTGFLTTLKNPLDTPLIDGTGYIEFTNIVGSFILSSEAYVRAWTVNDINQAELGVTLTSLIPAEVSMTSITIP